MTGKELRDVALTVAPTLTAAVLYFVGREFVSERWLLPAAFGLNFLGHIAVKALVLDHMIMRHVSWPYMLIGTSTVLAFVTLISDFSLFGWWTPPALLTLAGVFITNEVFRYVKDKTDDAAPPSD